MNKKPNVIYILADDMGYGDVSALNEQCAFNTPNLDEMVKNGVAFSDAHTTSAVCTPSRYGILTGRYNWRSELKSGVLTGYSKHLIEENRICVGDIFKENGYYTACIGKWHLGMDFPRASTSCEEKQNEMDDGVDYTGKIEYSPIENGFDYFFGISASLDMPPYVYIENDRFTATPNKYIEVQKSKGWYRPGLACENFVHEEVLDVLCDKVLEKIDEHKSEPFFIYFPMSAPHGPILPTKKFQGKSNTNEYGDFVLHCDDVVGRVMQKLKDLEIQDDTIVIYTSDNGCSPIADFEELKEKGHNPSYVFRGHKADIYEGGHRVPLLIQWKNGMPCGEMCNETVCLSDFFATISEMLNHDVQDNEAEDSISNLSLWKKPKSNAIRDYVVHQSIDGSLAIRNKKYKLVMCEGSGGWSDLTPQDYKYKIEDDNPEKYQLFDLKSDIGEKNNIIADHPRIYNELRKILKQYIFDGRSTVGIPQKNNGRQTWETIGWVES